MQDCDMRLEEAEHTGWAFRPEPGDQELAHKKRREAALSALTTQQPPEHKQSRRGLSAKTMGRGGQMAGGCWLGLSVRSLRAIWGETENKRVWQENHVGRKRQDRRGDANCRKWWSTGWEADNRHGGGGGVKIKGEEENSPRRSRIECTTQSEARIWNCSSPRAVVWDTLFILYWGLSF